ncbi:hypothetical protein GGI07_001068 [Coemansia sp. Benny D115]|nr:hypothetical protein GGI07_001068 [Coemansia sp. Benny D115]
MDKKKALPVGMPAALNLRAELDRARNESSKRTTRIPQTTNKLDNRNQGVEKRALNDILQQDTPETQRQLNKRIKQSLEAKAKIYDVLSTQNIDHSNLDDNLKRIVEESSVDFLGSYKTLHKNKTLPGGDEMVEITDEFGRSRQVPRNQAHMYMAEDHSRYSSDESSDEQSHRKELQDLRRNKGASHYAFSLDDAERHQQMLDLEQIREDTVAHREQASVSIQDLQLEQLEQRRELLYKSRNRYLHNVQST